MVVTAALVAISAGGASSSASAISTTKFQAAQPVLPVEFAIEAVATEPTQPSSERQTQRWRNDRIHLVEPEAWSDRSRDMVEGALAALPLSVRAQLGNPNLGAILISVNREGRTISGSQPYQRAANFFTTNEGRNEVVLFPDQSSRTVAHELGHAYNLRHTPAGSYAQVYLDDEMKSFLKAAGWRVITLPSALRNLHDHADVQVAHEGPPVWSRLSREDPLEDFANSFALYFTAPLELKVLSPARFQWFADHFADNE